MSDANKNMKKGAKCSSPQSGESSKKGAPIQRLRKTVWYTIDKVLEETVCPSCGRAMTAFKNPIAHVKKCFSIRRLGTVYRLHGYTECKCGLLISDKPKAKKLHVCVGAVPDFDPALSFEPEEPLPESPKPASSKLASSKHAPSPAKHQPLKSLEHKVLQPKAEVWIRNFVTPIKVDYTEMPEVEKQTFKHNPNLKPKPRVRNFDRRTICQQPDDVCVYSIIRKNGAISIAVHSPESKRAVNENNEMEIGKAAPRLPTVPRKRPL
ncbi:uncharacterized protein LOC111073840 [Drosophila obscura]|uniref:uncharacterized protein LOC111073840 n=1 Tax=Drosophila obscura TaxID=7282 RepID=UPI001BB1491A|nr:uncharacterized protein LOC111073840 [Drosophila obscura]XP_022222063.2 uncharacterized protein LOC111073840 [Drosophila obscura]XP_022222064.2 uncharacterized protein LOC111073840 [Drosophila obscura]XP_022222065.2 uncharacterized protein LOC111073840 [Drosophila obscura]